MDRCYEVAAQRHSDRSSNFPTGYGADKVQVLAFVDRLKLMHVSV
jgi:hypothetical protein